MGNLYNFSEIELVVFALVLLRVSAFVAAWPVLGVETVPAPIKILFALTLTTVIFPVINKPDLSVNLSSGQLIWLALRETFLGVCMGMLIRMMFTATRVAGDFVSLSIGLSGAQIYNPAMGGYGTPIDQFFLIMLSLFYLAIDGHHLFLTGLVDSFRVIPLGPALLSASSFREIGSLVQEVMIFGIKISAPVIFAILLVNFVMGILGKAVPQINILVTTLSVNIAVGLVVLIVALPVIVSEMPNLIEESAAQLFKTLRSF